ncbi:MAG: arginine--tRNA ligase [Caldilineaceae bacterium]
MKLKTTMQSLKEHLTQIVAAAFAAAGFDPAYGEVILSNRPELSQFQCNGALAAAKRYGIAPRQIAQHVVDRLLAKAEDSPLESVTIADPGFINLRVSDQTLVATLQAMALDSRLGCNVVEQPQMVIVDYGGANIAKPLHVGHLRAAIIGESLKRIARFLGHRVIGDVHLGDWGLQMGMVISEIARRQPQLPYFDAAYHGPYPAEPPVTIADLEEIYPQVSARAKAEPQIMEAARQATAELQMGRTGYRALWQQIFDISVADLKTDYGNLNIEFDLWLGESHTQERIPALVETLRNEGWAQESEGALVIDVRQENDNREIPPLILVKSDGAVLYGTTDLATIAQRVEEYQPDLILYVVDGRQHDHFVQVFRAAWKSGIAPATLQLEHIGFGTMNDKDGKPFKTRAGGVMKLKDLLQMITDKANERMLEMDIAKGYDETERNQIAKQVGIATLKYADLMNHPSKNYVFDLDRFTAFDGRTGPYLLYTAVRIKSILRKAEELGLRAGQLLPPSSEIERTLFLKLTELPEAIQQAFEKRAPNGISEYAYGVAAAFNTFYHEHHILNEPDGARRASWLQSSKLALDVLVLLLDLLGIEVPERM